MPLITEFPLLFTNDLVLDKYRPAAEVYKVVRVKQTKAILEDEKGLQYDVDMTRLIKAPEGTKFTPAQPVKSDTAPIKVFSVVRYVGARAAKRPGLYLVIRQNGHDSFSLVRIGDDSGAYVRGASPRTLETVDPVVVQRALEAIPA